MEETKKGKFSSTMINSLKKDGTDHIRIDSFADTTLGKLLSRNWRKKFFIPHIGEFLSPECFANWVASGSDEARFDPKFKVNKRITMYKELVLFAKYYQICSIRASIAKEMKKYPKVIPFIAYKVHMAGIREMDLWKDYSVEVRSMTNHILDEEKGPKVSYTWTNYPLLEERVIALIKEKFGIKETEENNAIVDESTDKNTTEAIKDLITKTVEVVETKEELTETQL